MKLHSRRAFLQSLAIAVPAFAVSRPAFAAAPGPRALQFFHTHTSERLVVEYYDGQAYLDGALTEVNRFLRDFRTGESHTIDPTLLDLLHGLGRVTGTSRPFEVISGYRSPVTNAMLRRRSEGVAAGSLHMQGMAIDVRLPDVRLDRLRDAALTARVGGVGYYPASQFVHVDTGRVRAW